MARLPMTPALLGDAGWRDRAACRHHKPEVYFPAADDLDTTALAKKICSLCPVRRRCLDAALEAGDTHGIRGGMTENERAALHERISERVDEARIAAALTGRRIHLTDAERREVLRTARRTDVAPATLAAALGCTVGHAVRRLHEPDEEPAPTPPGRGDAAAGGSRGAGSESGLTQRTLRRAV